MTRLVPITLAFVALAGVVTLPALAQTSTNYKLTEFVFNAGGHPDPSGGVSASAHHRIKLSSIGDPAAASSTLTSASNRMEVGFVSDYPPPGEVQQLRVMKDRATLRWSAEKSVGEYELYRDRLSALPGGYGACFKSAITEETTTDTTRPPVRNGFFYLVTARNRLGEEGVKGYTSAGVEETNATPCP